MPLQVRPVSTHDVIGFLTATQDTPLQQWPSWSTVKAEWGHELLGWFDGEHLVGTGLVLRRVLRPSRWSFDYLPEGPVIDWSRFETADVINPLVTRLHGSGSVTVKIGARLPVRRWQGPSLLTAMAQGARRWREVPPDTELADVVALATSLRALGAREYEAPGPGFGGTMQPRYGIEVPLAGRTVDDLQRASSTSFRRNVRKAERTGVQVRVSGEADVRANEDNVPGGIEADIATLHSLLVASGERDGFVPRGPNYFARMYRAMNDESPSRVRLYLADLDGQARAAALRVSVGGRSSYTYGGSSLLDRDARPSNALQWRMLLDAVAEGSLVHDLRGVSDTLDPDDPTLGLTQFKLAMGGEAVEYLGEWDIPVRPLASRALAVYLSRRLRV